MKPNGKPRAGLLGLGLDNQDGHKRVTRSERFAILGGSEETHYRMTETLIKTFETLDREGKELTQLEKQELSDLIEKSRPE